MTKRQWIVSAALTLFILILGASIFQILKNQKKSTVGQKPVTADVRPVKTSVFTPTNISKPIKIDGRANGIEKINLSPEVSGKLKKLNRSFVTGTYFKKGELLFSIDNRQEELTLFSLRSTLFNAITQMMPDLKFDYPNAFEKWSDYLSNFNIEATTEVLPEADSDQEKFFISGRSIYNQYYTIKSSEERLKKYKIYAPFEGVFISHDAVPGTVVSPGFQLGQIMNSYRFEMVSPIAMEDLEFIRTGQKLSVYSESNGQTYQAKVQRISKILDPTTQGVPLYISLSGKGLKDGMYLSGTIDGSEMEDVSAIPKQIILNNSEVYLVKDSSIVTKNLNIISRDENYVYTKSLSPNDQVISEGVNLLSPGMKVSISNN